MSLFPVFDFSIDRGGTFTDIYCESFESDTSPPVVQTAKLLSVDPSNYDDAPTEGIRRILESSLKQSIPRSSKIPS